MESYLMSMANIISYISPFFMGISLGLFGAGGSILTVPILVYFFLYSPIIATHYSLLVVGLVSAFGVAWQWSSGEIHLRKMLGFAISAMLGMFTIKRIILPELPEKIYLFANEVTLNQIILVVFAFLMIAAALSMIFIQISSDQGNTKKKNLFLLGMIGFGIGLITGFVGAGGGFLIVPSLIFIAGFAVKEATRASLFLIAINSLWGFVSGTRDWESIPFIFLFLIVGLAILGIIAGLSLQKRIPVARLKPAFGVFVLLMGIYVLMHS